MIDSSAIMAAGGMAQATDAGAGIAHAVVIMLFACLLWALVLAFILAAGRRS